MKIGICNVGVGAGHVNGSRRLKESLDFHGINWEQFFWLDKYPKGCPTHKEVPYAFKPYAILEAKKAGCDIVIWADSAVWAINGNVEALISYIETKGYYFISSGYSIGQWTSDKTIEGMCYARDDELHDPSKSQMIMACFFAIDFRIEFMSWFFMEYYHACLSNKGYLLKGDWKNDKLQVSKDIRCTGHRHDQSIISLLIKRHNLEIVNGHENFFQYYPYDNYVGKNWKEVQLDNKVLKSINFLTQGCTG